jgi:solute carrier family 7 (L-type amino acid transporter), member 9/15
MNNVKDPVRTLKIAGPLGLGICTVLYLLANVAYFAYGLCHLSSFDSANGNVFSRAASKKEIKSSGVTVAALFFKNVFGVQAERALSVFVALRLIIFLKVVVDLFTDPLICSALG